MKWILLIATVVSLTSCNTMIGVWRDTKAGFNWSKEKFRIQVTEDRNRNTGHPFTDVDEFALCGLLSSWVKTRNTPMNRRLICYLSLVALFLDLPVGQKNG